MSLAPGNYVIYVEEAGKIFLDNYAVKGMNSQYELTTDPFVPAEIFNQRVCILYILTA